MIHAIVVDDEWYNLEEISDLLMETGAFLEPKKYQNPLSALKEIDRIRPEVAFIDIEMPEIDGIALAQILQEINPDMIIVFVTSWNQYAVQAFDVNALDYILKPINVVRFQKMIVKVKSEVLSIRLKRGSSLQITCFGSLVARIDNVPIKWERAKSEELFAFLLMHHNQYMSKEVIIDNLWSEYEIQKALQILQTAVCRLRNIFSGLNRKVNILYDQSRYCLTITDAQCDLFEVEDTIQSLQNHNLKNLNKLEMVIELCKKGFLAEQGYLWSFEKDEELKQELVTILNYFIKQNTVKQSKEKIKFLRYLAELLPYEDSVNYQLLYIYKNCGYISDARQHYQWLVKTLKEQYDSEPSRRIKALFGII